MTAIRLPINARVRPRIVPADELPPCESERPVCGTVIGAALAAGIWIVLAGVLL